LVSRGTALAETILQTKKKWAEGCALGNRALSVTASFDHLRNLTPQRRRRPRRIHHMTTPIVMLVLMLGPYLVVRVLSIVTQRDYNARRAAGIGLTVLFVFTGIGHFIETASLAQMLPPWIPERVLLVYLTGVLEFAVAAGFLIERSRRFTGWVAAVMLVLFFPVNVYAAFNHVSMGGHAWGPVYLLIRGPLQGIILLWIYWFAIKRPDYSGRKEIADVFGKGDRLSKITAVGANRHHL
jgi:uncharacterized membrane protein